MKFPLNMVVKVDNQEELDVLNNGFIMLKDASENLDVSTKDTLHELLARAELRKVDSCQESRVLINGQPIVTGTKEEMIHRFRTECDMHQNSNVIMQEWKNGKFEAVRTRKVQLKR